MCRNIKTLHNFKPPATEDEIRASSLQFVRKLSGFTQPSKANQLALDRAVDQVASAARELLDSLVTNAPPAIAKWRRPRPERGRRTGPLIRHPTRYLAAGAGQRRGAAIALRRRGAHDCSVGS